MAKLRISKELYELVCLILKKNMYIINKKLRKGSAFLWD